MALRKESVTDICLLLTSGRKKISENFSEDNCIIYENYMAFLSLYETLSLSLSQT